MNKVHCSIESNSGSNGINANCSKISTRSIDIPQTHEGGGYETIDCDPGVSLALKKVDIAECDEVIDEDQSLEVNLKKKPKLTEVSAGTSDLEMEEVILSASLLDLPHRMKTTLDQPIGSESVTRSCTENLSSEKRYAACSAGKKLLVLDVNGLLVDISSYVPYNPDPDDIIHKKAVFKRPYCDDFLKFCFERFNVGFWTSRAKRNMDPLLDFLLGSDKHKLLFSWDQSHCTDTGFYTVEKRHKPLLLKKLKKLWEKCDPDLPWDRGVFNETNTLLLDDTPYKALSNPRYNAIFPYTYRFQDLKDNSLGPGGDLRIYLEGLAAAENVQEYVKQNPFGQRPITEKNLSWGYYRKVMEGSTTPPRDNGRIMEGSAESNAEKLGTAEAGHVHDNPGQAVGGEGAAAEAVRGAVR